MKTVMKNSSNTSSPIVNKSLAATGLIAASILLSACGNQPPAPDWVLTAEASADKATSAYLQGQQRVQDLQWQKARTAVASTARPDIAALMELKRCAAQVASLEWDECPGFQKLAQDAPPAEQAYARYLTGKVQAADVSLLPEAQRAVAARVAAGALPAGAGAQEAAAIKEPLSRLLAAAVLLRAGAASPDLLTLGVDTASAQGWNRPLMAWLLLQAKAAEQAGDGSSATAIQRRLDLLQSAGTLKK